MDRVCPGKRVILKLSPQALTNVPDTDEISSRCFAEQEAPCNSELQCLRVARVVGGIT